jgi:hypothetical protein
LTGRSKVKVAIVGLFASGTERRGMGPKVSMQVELYKGRF